MAESHISVTFQVYVLRHSRWEIYARFGPDDRVAAVRLGKKMDRNPSVTGVKVVKDVYDDYADIAEEHVVYKSRRGRRNIGRSLETGTGVSRSEYVSAIRTYRDAQTTLTYSPKDDQLPAGAVGKALSGTFFAFILAVLLTGLLAYIFGETESAEVSTAQSGRFVAILTLLCAASLAIAFALAVVISPKTGSAATAWRRLRKHLSGTDQAEDAPSGADPEIGLAKRVTAPLRRKKGGISLPKDANKQLRIIITYLRKAVGPVRGAYDLRDPYIKFGINLFAAGVTEALCQERGIPPEAAQKVMSGAVRALGVPAEQADGFSGAYVEYLISDPRYMDMFASGREAIFAELAQKADSALRLHTSIGTWIKPATPPEEKLSVTVMFTSIAGFDDLLAERGDETAREALRIHTTIAARALMEYGGKQIKQLQSGIMAAFMNPENALRAAFAIRDGLREHSKKNLELPLSANVGINCGEPIVEGNDLFGVTVQLAARIVAIAKGGEILVSAAIRAALGKTDDLARLEPYGPFVMKGFTDPITLFKVAFTTDAVKPVKAQRTAS
ncbi:MAG: adenylate/guanylate cyclase domain-containing protein [Rhodospirillales bacterium]|jgi:adenylate cyclase|nr:adenylate/guanylate cyclase domain-containing protein [Rhodospirillales bacterium]